MRSFFYFGLILVPAAALDAGCASKGAAGSETHFVCSKDADCRDGSQCIENHCEAAENDGGASSGGGTPGTGGAPATGSGGSPADGTGGSGRGGAGGNPIDGTGGAGIGAAGPCPMVDGPPPLDDGCTEDVCHLAIRFDFQTLALKGYASIGGPARPTTSAQALQTARTLFKANLDYVSDPTVEDAEAGVFRVYSTPSDFGAFALVGSESGKVITAGGIIWSGAGHYMAPTTWKPASDIACTTWPVKSPAASYVDPDSSCDFVERPFVADDALNTALATNLATHYAERGPFTAFTYLYKPTVGTCDPTVAEYIVVLTSGPR